MADILEKELKNKQPRTLTSAEIQKLLLDTAGREKNLYLLAALSKKIISPDRGLTQAIVTTKDNKDLISVALTLRYGANPNIYINSTDLGQVHILVYTYYKLHKLIEPATLQNIMYLLTVMGSKLVNPAYGPGVIQSAKINEQSQSVEQWLTWQEFTLPPFESTPADLRSSIGSILNRADLIQGQGNYIDLLIRAHSSIVRNYSDKLQKRNVYYYFKQCVDNFNLIAFQFLLGLGYRPNYTLINYIISMMDGYHQSNNGIIYGQLIFILQDAVKYGAKIDQEQISIIEKIDKDLAEKVRQDYNNPRWVKVCRTLQGDDDDESYLRSMAYWLNLNPEQNKSELCKELRKAAQADQQAYIKAAIRKQQLRTASTLADPQEFISGQTDKVVDKYLCINRDVGKNYPYLYNDLDLIVYQDGADNVWCLTPDMFDEIRQTERNPITQDEMPPDVMAQLNNQRNTLKRLGLLDVPNKTVSEALEELKNITPINNDDLQDRKLALKQLAAMYCQSDCNDDMCAFGTANLLQLGLLKPNQMIQILNNWGLNAENIGFTSILPELQGDTFIYIAYNILKSKPQLTAEFFRNVQKILNQTQIKTV